MRGRALLAPATLSAGVFVVYALGACPTIFVGDSGELATAVHVLGIPHPTGYPLYVLLGKAWTLLLPIGSVAWRLSLFSALAAAATCGVVYGLCRGARIDVLAAVFAALLLAFGPSFWGEANVQRVYALGALFVALATGAASRWYRRGDARSLVLAFFLCGLGTTAHAFLAVYAAALAAFALATDPGLLRRPRPLAAGLGAFVLGLLPYVYLPWRSRADPPLDWGDPETLVGFLRVVVRRDFWQRAWIESPADLAAITLDYLRSFAAELTWAGAGLALLGLLVGARRTWPVLLLVLVMAGNLGALAVHGSRTDLFVWHRYYIPSYVMAALLAGLGCHLLLARLPRALHMLPLVIPATLLLGGWRDFDRSRYRIAEDFSAAVLRSLPPGAHLIATDDNVLFVLMYLHLVEGRRPDVDLILQGVGGAELPPLRFDPDAEPLFFTHHPNWTLPALEIVPRGVVFQAVRAGRPLPAPAAHPHELDGEHDPGVPKDYLTHNLLGHFHYMLGVTFEPRDWPRARREFMRAAAAAPENDVLFYNLGLIYRRSGLLKDAVAAFRRAHAINPRHLASTSRPHAADRLAETRAELRRVRALERALAEDPALSAIPPGSAEHVRRLAALLEARGEGAAARGHRLRAAEAAAGG